MSVCVCVHMCVWMCVWLCGGLISEDESLMIPVGKVGP